MPELDTRIGGAIVGMEWLVQETRQHPQKQSLTGKRDDRATVPAIGSVAGSDRQGSHSQRHTCRQIPGVGAPAGAKSQAQQQQLERPLDCSVCDATSVLTRPRRMTGGDEGRQADGQYKERHAHHMGVQICIEEGEIGKLVDLPMRHDTAGIPVPPLGPEGQLLLTRQEGIGPVQDITQLPEHGCIRQPASRISQALPEQFDLAQVPRYSDQ